MSKNDFEKNFIDLHFLEEWTWDVAKKNIFRNQFQTNFIAALIKVFEQALLQRSIQCMSLIQ